MNLNYLSEGQTFSGRVFRPPAGGARPGILVCHDGTGPGEHAWTRAQRLAELGYIAYAPDFLGGPFADRATHMEALELARSGAEVAAVVSFHGGLGSPAPAAPGSIRAALLVCAGAADPFIGRAERQGFEEEMTQAGADWQMIVYSGALHGFTHPDLRPETRPGCG